MSETPDKLVACEECGKDFLWTGREHDFFAHGGHEPLKRCRECDQARKQREDESRARGGPREEA